MTKEKTCDHGDGGAMRCTAPTNCLNHSHKCRACGMEVPAEARFTNRFTPFRATPNSNTK